MIRTLALGASRQETATRRHCDVRPAKDFPLAGQTRSLADACEPEPPMVQGPCTRQVVGPDLPTFPNLSVPGIPAERLVMKDEVMKIEAALTHPALHS